VQISLILFYAGLRAGPHGLPRTGPTQTCGLTTLVHPTFFLRHVDQALIAIPT